MSPRPVLLYPDPALKQVAVPVQASEVDAVAAELAGRDGLRTSAASGIAAPQIGLGVRVRSSTSPSTRRRRPRTACSSWRTRTIVEAEGSDVAREGCLSLPDVTANVRRATRVVVEHLGGTVECRGFEARAVQHELDHLDGILFLDRVESLVDDVFRRRSYAESSSSAASSGGGEAGASSKDSPGGRIG